MACGRRQLLPYGVKKVELVAINVLGEDIDELVAYQDTELLIHSF